MQLSEHFELAEFLVSETAARRGIANEPTPEVIENLRRLCQSVLQVASEIAVIAIGQAASACSPRVPNKPHDSF